jgi:adenylylsulfate kinase-like enzyme
MVSPYRNQREEFKARMGDKLVEACVEAESDPGRPRREDRFEGYEPPVANYVWVNTVARSIPDCVALILSYLQHNPQP